MMSETIRAAVKTRPFIPFGLRMPDGRLVHVPSPECIFLVPESRNLVVAQSAGTFNVIDMFLVTDLEYRTMPNVGPGPAGTPEVSPAAWRHGGRQ
jgi:hypothetical protein